MSIIAENRPCCFCEKITVQIKYPLKNKWFCTECNRTVKEEKND